MYLSLLAIKRVKVANMEKRSIYIAMFLIVSALATVATGARADDNERLTLGYSSLGLTTSDPKSPSPGSLTVKYGFGLLKDITPYIGTGVAYILPPEARPGENSTKIKAGVAGQAGLNINLGASSLLKIDYQYLHVTPDPAQGGSGSDPHKIGIGLEIKF